MKRYEALETLFSKVDLSFAKTVLEEPFHRALTTKNFQNKMIKEYRQNWDGSLSFEKVVRYLPHFKSAIQLPICVIGIDL